MEAILSILLTLTAGPDGFFGGPVRFTLDSPIAEHRILQVADEAGKVIGYAQKNGTEYIMIAPALSANQAMNVSLSPAADAPMRVVLTMADHKIDVVIDGKHFTSYHFAPDLPKPFLYPVLLGEKNHRVTRGYPAEMLDYEVKETQDHPHHASWWVAQDEVNDGNFWHVSKDPAEQDQQKTREILEVTSGPVFGKLRAVNDWNHSDGHRIVQEEREYIFFAADEANRTTDMKVTFTAVDGDVTFRDTKEGGICSIRMNPLIDQKNGNGDMVNSRGGKGEAECWGKPAEWCDYVGELDGEKVGAAIMDNPANLRHPSRWHIRNYGLYSTSVFGLGAFGEATPGDYTIPKGDDLAFQFRVVMHLGDSEEAGIAKRYSAYTAAPTVAIK